MLVYGITYITYPISLSLPTSEIFDEIRKEMLQKPQNHFEAILLFFSISIIPAFIEEIFFRGLIYRNIRRKYGIVFSAFLLTIVFYLFHLDPQMIFFLTIGNLVLCLTYEYTKSLVVPFVIHAGINFSGLLFYMNGLIDKT
jgi:membrane protease YdiL (CAAX protease family)